MVHDPHGTRLTPRTIGVVIRPGVQSAALLGRELCSWIANHHLALAIDDSAAQALKGVGCLDLPSSLSHQELVRVADPIVTLGGDGTLIGIARHVTHTSPVILGIHFGNLGFLTETTPAELFAALERTLAGQAIVAERAMIRATVFRDGSEVFSSQALNDAVVLKQATARLLDIDLAVNDEAIMRLRADGIICATPTGSTAYSLAAGGSIVHPSLEALLVTPICPHSLTVRPLVLSLHDKLSLRIPDYDGAVVLSVDGQVSLPLQPGDLIEVRESPQRIKIVQSHSRSHFEILRTKLNWGIANKPD